MNRGKSTFLALTWAVCMSAPAPAEANTACSTVPELCNLPVLSIVEQPDYEKAVDLVFIGDGFTSADTWLATANSAVAAFKGQTATGIYPAFPAAFNIHIVTVLSQTSDVGDTDTNDTALGMVATGNNIITWNGYRAGVAASNAPDVDVTIAMANTTAGRANAYFPTQLLSGGSIRLNKSAGPLSHELGHALFHLADEYTESALCTNPSEASMVDEPNVTADPACKKFQTAPGAACVKGGNYCTSGVYRPANDCLMRTSGNKAMCPVCARERDALLLQRLSGRDAIEPWLVVTSPTPGQTATAWVNLTVAAYDHGLSPVAISFTIDGAWVGSIEDVTSSAQLAWDSRAVADGPHELRAYAEDSHGHAVESIVVPFVVANAPDTTAPGLQVTSPSPNQTVVGSLFAYVTAKQSASSGATATDIEALWCTVDGSVAWGAAGTSMLTASIDAATLEPGTHTFQAFARDWSQHVVASPEISFQVKAPSANGDGGLQGQPGGSAGGEGSGLFIESPSAWDDIGPVFSLQYRVQTSLGAKALELWLDGALAMELPLPPSDASQFATSKAVAVDASGWPAGVHQLEVRAETAQGAASSGLLALMRTNDIPPFASILSPASAGNALTGITQLAGVAWHSTGINHVTMVVGDAIACTFAGPLGSCSWNTAQVVDGCFSLRAVAFPTLGAPVVSPAITMCVDSKAPTVKPQWPLDGAVVPPGVLVASAEVSPTGASAMSLELAVDGLPASKRSNLVQGMTALWATLSPGPHALTYTATDSAGNTAIASLGVIAASCSDVGCDDANPCTKDTCGISGGCVHTPLAGCCTSDGGCADSDPCTADSCNPDGCAHTSIAGCCSFGFQCQDGDPCSQDLCSGPGGACEAPSNVCCTSSSECAACGSGTCLGASPAFCSATPTGCCAANGDCADGNPCTVDTCTGSQCTHVPLADCCGGPDDCDDADACTEDICLLGLCSHLPKAFCCNTDADCASNNPCAAPSCNVAARYCIQNIEPGCCTFSHECTDYDSCTTDTCVEGECAFEPTCCSSAEECDDGDECTNDSCSKGFCSHTPIAGCCPEGAWCGATCGPGYGDLEGNGTVSISDVACTILATLWFIAPSGGSPPSCLSDTPQKADLTCDGAISVVDVLMSIHVALGLSIGAPIDADLNKCADACQ